MQPKISEVSRDKKNGTETSVKKYQKFKNTLRGCPENAVPLVTKNF